MEYNDSFGKTSYSIPSVGISFFLSSLGTTTSSSLETFFLETTGLLTSIAFSGSLVTAKFSKAVCGILSGKLQPGLKASINKVKQEYEIYIPFSDFPTNQQQYNISFRVYLIDEEKNERKYLAGDFISQNQIKQ